MNKCFTIFIAALCLQLFSFYSPAQTITTVVGNGTPGHTGDGGPAAVCELQGASYVAFDHAGNMYIADGGNNVVRKVDVSGNIFLFAGNYTAGYGGDHGPATMANLNFPTGVAVDKTGNVYIADFSNNVIRMVDLSGTITTVAGNNTLFAYSGDNGLATDAGLAQPIAVAIDTAGNLYIADYLNNAIRKVNTHDTITTYAGTSITGYTGDNGPASVATLNTPADVFADDSGNIYIADGGNNVIRKVNAHDTITTFAGNGSVFGGDHGPAIAAGLNNPDGVGMDSAGNIYISDFGNSRIRVVDVHGIINTYAGNGGVGFVGDNGPATSAQLNSPTGVCGRGAGVIYISDVGNNRIRKVAPVTTNVDNKSVPVTGIDIYPNPARDKVSITATENIEAITITDMTGRVIFRSQPLTKTTAINIDQTGMYIITVTTVKETTVNKVTIMK